MHDDEQLILEREHDSFSDSPNPRDRSTSELVCGRCNCAKDKRTRESKTEQLVTHDTFGEGLDINGHIGKFRHAFRNYPCKCDRWFLS